MDAELFRRPVLEVARELIGAELYVNGVGGAIVEVEAYHPTDAASHAFGNRRTARNGAMFLAGGHAYVYRSYGVHWCLNLVCEAEGLPAAVLVRALEPLHGLAEMRARRGAVSDRLLCSGPGRLCQALAVTGEHDGLALDKAPFDLRARAFEPQLAIGARIGLTKAPELPWRFGLAGSRYLSRAFAA
jgi:DNA-3-methyladenine glycosylase